MPTSSTPLRDSIPVFIDFIDQVHKDKGHIGIILVGHSIGGALVLSITHEAQGRLPILGVSAMGCLPSLKPLGLLGETDPEQENPRFIVEPSPENIKRFMGRMEWLNLDALSQEIVEVVFEPGRSFQSRCKEYTNFLSGIKSEIREYQTRDLYEYLLDTVFPSIQVPVQYLAAENEILWDDEDPLHGKSIFDALVSYFVSAPEIDAAILPRGGHNYEFSQNVGLLLQRRNDFVQKLV